MSLYDFVYNLQRKPYKTKKRILAGLLIVSFIALSVFWVIMFRSQVTKAPILSGGTEETLGGKDQNLLSPVAALIEGVKGLKSDISNKIGELNIGPSEKERPVYELPQN